MTVAALDAISRACFRSFANLPDARLLEGNGVFGVSTGIPLTFFSGIAESRLSRDEVPRVIRDFGERPFRWWISPASEPADLDAVLLEHGMRHAFDSTGMVADLATLTERTAPVAIERVDDLADWIDVFLEGFQKPRDERDLWLRAYAHCDGSWVHFLGFVDGKPVATTSLLRAGTLAGIYHVVTLPAFRGRGIGAAMTLAAMREGRQGGARTAVLQSSEMGESVYRSVGFESVCPLRLFDWRPRLT